MPRFRHAEVAQGGRGGPLPTFTVVASALSPDLAGYEPVPPQRWARSAHPTVSHVGRVLHTSARRSGDENSRVGSPLPTFTVAASAPSPDLAGYEPAPPQRWSRSAHPAVSHVGREVTHFGMPKSQSTVGWAVLCPPLQWRHLHRLRTSPDTNRHHRSGGLRLDSPQ